jgi:hypothetical protein
VYRQFSGHVSNGIVYLEESAGAESVSLETGRVYGPSMRWRVYKGSLRHSDMPSQTAALTVYMVDDENQETQTVANTIAMDTQRGNEFYVNRSGEFMRVALDYSGSVAGTFQDVRMWVENQGKAGRIAT